MYRVKVKKQNIITNQADWQTQETADTWLAEQIANESFGKAEHQIEVSPKVLDDEGNIIQEEVFETIPAEYTIEIEDVTEEIELENVRKKEKKEKKESLKKIKWTEVNTIAELKVIVKGIITELED